MCYFLFYKVVVGLVDVGKDILDIVKMMIMIQLSCECKVF